jgi:hypothetical protein
MSAAAFRQALAAGDVKALRAIWAADMPHLPQPQSDADAEIVMHRTRTETACLPLDARAWSHRWLTERSLPSGLPDALKPKAERLYPVVQEGVLIGVKARSEIFRPAAAEIQRAMENAVADAYAERRTDPAFVSAQMKAARERTAKALFGAVRPPASEG